MGTSAIRPIILGQTGPTGSKGPRGPVGPTGTGTGLTGPQGNTGNFISTLSVSPGGMYLVNGNQLLFIPDILGPTGYTGTVFGGNTGNGLTLFSSASGFTLSLRGLSFSGNLFGEITGGSIVVTPIDVYYGVTLAAGITTDRVLYSKTVNTIDSTRLVYGRTFGEFSLSNAAGITPGALPVYAEISGSVINVATSSESIILGVTNGAVYRIETPIGLSAFSLVGGTFNSNELISFTMFVEGNGFNQFPENVYFEDTPYSSYFGCGTNIMNVMTNDMGQNWYATIVERGYGQTSCSNFEGVGSCCYLNGNTLACAEYVTEVWCNKKLGTFNLFTPCSNTCGATAICCSNGYCVSGVSKSECEYFNGKYYAGISCDNIQHTDTTPNTDRQCYKSNLAPTSCCTGGQCIPDVTFKICMDYYKGYPFTGTCCELNCGAEPPRRISGACCVESTSQCVQTTPAGCSALSGVFYGDGTECATVNCCFTPPAITGSCCLSDGTCTDDDITEEDCVALAGQFTPKISCSAANCATEPVSPLKGLCCRPTECLSDVTREECTSVANSLFFPNVMFNDWTDNLYKWTDTDCAFCNASRYAIAVKGSNTNATAEPGVDLKCFPNKGTSNEFPWSPRRTTEEVDSSYFATKKITLNNANPPIEIYPTCGSVDIIVDNENSDSSERICLKDSFLVGQIFTAKYEKDGSVTNPGILANSSQSEFQSFIYGKYLSDIGWVWGDYSEKLCKGLCKNIPETNLTFNESRCNSSVCILNPDLFTCANVEYTIPQFTYCTLFKEMSKIADVNSAGGYCDSACCSGTDSGPGEIFTMPGGYVFALNRYCSQFVYVSYDVIGPQIGQQPDFTLLDTYSIPCTTNFDMIATMKSTYTYNQTTYQIECNSDPDPCKELN
jgi:hypothetical protein